MNNGILTDNGSLFKGNTLPADHSDCNSTYKDFIQGMQLIPGGDMVLYSQIEKGGDILDRK
jgi:hypothetical protein